MSFRWCSSMTAALTERPRLQARSRIGSTYLRGDGSLFWAKAMAIAERRAVERRPDYLLWLNDDVVLQQDALGTLITAMGGNARRIVVGTVVDPVSGDVTYGGFDRVDWHPLRYRHVAPTDGVPRPVTTISGNVVLVPRCVYSDVGGIDGGFSHGRADWDYGLRAKRLGIEPVVTGRPVGTCPPGVYGVWRDPALPLPEKSCGSSSGARATRRGRWLGTCDVMVGQVGRSTGLPLSLGSAGHLAFVALTTRSKKRGRPARVLSRSKRR